MRKRSRMIELDRLYDDLSWYQKCLERALENGLYQKANFMNKRIRQTEVEIEMMEESIKNETWSNN